MTRRTGYTSTVTSWRSAIGATVSAMAIAAVAELAAGSSGPRLAISLGVIALLGGAAALHLATARLSVSATGVGIGAGVRGRTRWISADAISHGEPVRLSWPQVFGIGLPVRRRTTRLTVRAGAALALRLQSGERIWISTPDPTAAMSVLDMTTPDNTKESR
jgi:hypothetical protein